MRPSCITMLIGLLVHHLATYDVPLYHNTDEATIRCLNRQGHLLEHVVREAWYLERPTSPTDATRPLVAQYGDPAMDYRTFLQRYIQYIRGGREPHVCPTAVLHLVGYAVAAGPACQGCAARRRGVALSRRRRKHTTLTWRRGSIPPRRCSCP